MYCLFEIGMFFARYYVGKGRRDGEDEADDESEAS